MNALIEVATDHGYHSIMARISDAKESSVGLHEEFGFVLIGVEKEIGRKFNRWLDVAVMQRLL
jgi:phosphinothricin acetyltransferase